MQDICDAIGQALAIGSVCVTVRELQPCKSEVLLARVVRIDAQGDEVRPS
jgi:hypothetical protein